MFFNYSGNNCKLARFNDCINLYWSFWRIPKTYFFYEFEKSRFCKYGKNGKVFA